jgi:hypothetical protein
MRQLSLPLPAVLDGVSFLELGERDESDDGAILCGLQSCDCRTGRNPTECARRYRRDRRLDFGEPPDSFVDVRHYMVSVDEATGRRSVVHYDRRYSRAEFVKEFGGEPRQPVRRRGVWTRRGK